MNRSSWEDVTAKVQAGDNADGALGREGWGGEADQDNVRFQSLLGADAEDALRNGGSGPPDQEGIPREEALEDEIRDIREGPQDPKIL